VQNTVSELMDSGSERDMSDDGDVTDRITIEAPKVLKFNGDKDSEGTKVCTTTGNNI